MKSLESCHELDFSKIEFHERKQKITHPKTILLGPPKSGKSYLIFDYLSHFQSSEYLYINFEDFRNKKDEIKSYLEEFIQKNKIQVLVLENFNFDIELPQCDSIIITSTLPKKLRGFKTLTLMPLDFEEFLLHDNRHQNTTNSFNYFLKFGNLPEIINIEEHEKIKKLQEVISLFSKTTLQENILKLLFEFIDEKKSIHQLYNLMKKEHKISKDSFYENCKEFEENSIIFFISKYNQPKAVKKLYSYNHAFLNTVSHNKKFKNEFANLIFLELVNKNNDIYYLDNIDFFIPKHKSVIIVHPFFNKLLISTIKKRIFNTLEELKIKKLFIITVGNSETFFLNNIEVQILPFYEWALLN